jgi:hypothetical protein
LSPAPALCHGKGDWLDISVDKCRDSFEWVSGQVAAPGR